MRAHWEPYPVFVCCEMMWDDRPHHLFYPGEPMDCFIRVECEPAGEGLFLLRIVTGLEIGGIGTAGTVELKSEEPMNKNQILTLLGSITWESIKPGVRANLVKSYPAWRELQEHPEKVPEENPGHKFEHVVNRAALEITKEL